MPDQPENPERPQGGQPSLLAAARKRRGLSQQAVAEQLRLRVEIIRLLEAGRLAAVGSPVFAKGHLRAYATLVDVPYDQLLAAHETQLGQTAPVLPGRQRSRLWQLPAETWKLLVAIGALIGTLIAIAVGVVRAFPRASLGSLGALAVAGLLVWWLGGHPATLPAIQPRPAPVEPALAARPAESQAPSADSAAGAAAALASGQASAATARPGPDSRQGARPTPGMAPSAGATQDAGNRPAPAAEQAAMSAAGAGPDARGTPGYSVALGAAPARGTVLGAGETSGYGAVPGAGQSFTPARGMVLGAGATQASEREAAAGQPPVSNQPIGPLSSLPPGQPAPQEAPVSTQPIGPLSSLPPGQPAPQDSPVSTQPRPEPPATPEPATPPDSPQAGTEPRPPETTEGFAEYEHKSFGRDRMEFRFTAECQVVIVNRRGKEIYNHLHRNRDLLKVKGRAPFNISLSNPQAVAMTFKGEPVDLTPFVLDNRVAELVLDD